MINEYDEIQKYKSRLYETRLFNTNRQNSPDTLNSTKNVNNDFTYSDESISNNELETWISILPRASFLSSYDLTYDQESRILALYDVISIFSQLLDIFPPSLEEFLLVLIHPGACPYSDEFYIGLVKYIYLNMKFCLSMDDKEVLFPLLTLGAVKRMASIQRKTINSRVIL